MTGYQATLNLGLLGDAASFAWNETQKLYSPDTDAIIRAGLTNFFNSTNYDAVHEMYANLKNLYVNNTDPELRDFLHGVDVGSMVQAAPAPIASSFLAAGSVLLGFQCILNGINAHRDKLATLKRLRNEYQSVATHPQRSLPAGRKWSDDYEQLLYLSEGGFFWDWLKADGKMNLLKALVDFSEYPELDQQDHLLLASNPLNPPVSRDTLRENTKILIHLFAKPEIALEQQYDYQAPLTQLGNDVRGGNPLMNNENPLRTMVCNLLHFQTEQEYQTILLTMERYFFEDVGLNTLVYLLIPGYDMAANGQMQFIKIASQDSPLQEIFRLAGKIERPNRAQADDRLNALQVAYNVRYLEPNDPIQGANAIIARAAITNAANVIKKPSLDYIKILLNKLIELRASVEATLNGEIAQLEQDLQGNQQQTDAQYYEYRKNQGLLTAKVVSRARLNEAACLLNVLMEWRDLLEDLKGGKDFYPQRITEPEKRALFNNHISLFCFCKTPRKTQENYISLEMILAHDYLEGMYEDTKVMGNAMNSSISYNARIIFEAAYEYAREYRHNYVNHNELKWGPLTIWPKRMLLLLFLLSSQPSWFTYVDNTMMGKEDKTLIRYHTEYIYLQRFKQIMANCTLTKVPFVSSNMIP